MKSIMNKKAGSLNEIRSVNRKRLYEVWQHAKNNDLDHLPEEERQIGQCMLKHEEYHNQFEIADLLVDHDFKSDKEVNPFIHVTFHVIVENQLKSRNPIEAYQFYNSMRNRKMSHHEIIHLIAYILAPIIFQTLKQSDSFDNDLYKNLLKKYKGKDPEKIYSSLEY